MALPQRFPDRREIAAVRVDADRVEPGEEAGGEPRRVGWAGHGSAGYGELVFLDLVDRSGKIQLLVPRIAPGPSISTSGTSSASTGIPAKTKRGEPSLAVTELELLANPPAAARHLPRADRDRDSLPPALPRPADERGLAPRLRGARADGRSVRRYLDGHGFVEVEAPILQPRYGGALADPFVTRSNELDQTLYLRIATELYLKRLIVGGLERVYELGRDFRNESVSYKHAPEFTMVEWYEAYADYEDTMRRIEELVESVARETIGTTKVTFRGHEVDLAAPWKRVKLVEQLEERGLWTRDEAELRKRLAERGVDTSANDTWSKLVDHALSHFVEPDLIQPTILHDYPVEVSPFARPTDNDPSIVERFEFFVGGMELGNAFTEINDPDEQAERFEQQAADAQGQQGDPDYVEALAYGMPPTGGLGLGIDRLVMVLTGAANLREVVLFPAMRT
jgi:lysyl-tRNA synthetase class 2